MVMSILLAHAYLFLVSSLGNSYRDILHCNKMPFYLRGAEEDSSIMDGYIMHSVSGFPFSFSLKDIVVSESQGRKIILVFMLGSFLSNDLKRVFMQLNHVFKTRDIVTKNDAKVAKHRENAKDELPNDDSFLDQGFTRPKVVLIALLNELVRLRTVLLQLNMTQSDPFHVSCSLFIAILNMQNSQKEFFSNDCVCICIILFKLIENNL